MQVSLAVFGRFHAFDLAAQLQKHFVLSQLITTYPRFKAVEFGVESRNVSSLVQIELLYRAWLRLPKWVKRNVNDQLFWLEWFDREVVRTLGHSRIVPDLFVGWSGACLWSLQEAQRLGAKAIAERGSSHMSYQTEILTEEYERWGLKFSATHPGVYERELVSYQECDYISVPSLYVKRTFLAAGIPASKLIHVPYGVSLDRFFPVKKEDSIFRVIHCGGITYRKGVQYLLQAFSELQLKDAELWLVGTIDPAFQPQVDRYQSDQIIYKGQRSQSELRWFYSQCSVFCLASIEEGLAMVQPQAMACGLPVIHTTNTGGEDIVREGVDGFCIPIRDVEAIKEKILFLYENPERREEMSSNALQQANSALSWDDYGNKIIAAYQDRL